MYSLFARPDDQTLALLQSMTRQAPFRFLDEPMLFLGLTESKEQSDKVYEVSANTFSVQSETSDGTTILILNVENVSGTFDDSNSALTPCIYMSEAIHQIPRNYRAFLNSMEETFHREKYVLRFSDEFLTEYIPKVQP